jgi:hypothetical protein
MAAGRLIKPITRLSCWLMVQRRAGERVQRVGNRGTRAQAGKWRNAQVLGKQTYRMRWEREGGDRIELGPAGRAPPDPLLVARCRAGYGEGFIERVGGRVFQGLPAWLLHLRGNCRSRGWRRRAFEQALTAFFRREGSSAVFYTHSWERICWNVHAHVFGCCCGRGSVD